jgi:hypothetical protein
VPFQPEVVLAVGTPGAWGLSEEWGFSAKTAIMLPVLRFSSAREAASWRDSWSPWKIPAVELCSESRDSFFI